MLRSATSMLRRICENAIPADAFGGLSGLLKDPSPTLGVQKHFCQLFPEHSLFLSPSDMTVWGAKSAHRLLP